MMREPGWLIRLELAAGCFAAGCLCGVCLVWAVRVTRAWVFCG